jgi:hypothetical protein
MNYYRFKGNIKTCGGITISSGFNRIVHGGRGDYVEFDEDQIFKSELNIPEEEKYRLLSDLVYYIEYRTRDDVKVYLQKKLVDYADYKLNKFYISPRDLENFDKIRL